MLRRKKKNSKLFLNFFLLLLLIFPIICVYIFLNSALFKITKIESKIDASDCISSEIIEKNFQIYNQNIFFFNSKKIEEKLRQNYICVKNLIFTKKIPDSLEITVSVRQPIAKLTPLHNREATATFDLEEIATDSAKYYGSSQDIFLVDEEGRVFSKGSESLQLPTVFITGDINLGDELGILIANTLKILEKINWLGLETKKIEIFGREFLVVNANAGLVFKLKGNIDIQLASLQLILEQAKIDSQSLEFIDLRFDKPVVRFVPIERNRSGKR